MTETQQISALMQVLHGHVHAAAIARFERARYVEHVRNILAGDLPAATKKLIQFACRRGFLVTLRYLADHYQLPMPTVELPKVEPVGAAGVVGTELLSDAMEIERFNDLVNGALNHPLLPFRITRLANALLAVTWATGQAGTTALEKHCADQVERDRRHGDEDF